MPGDRRCSRSWPRSRRAGSVSLVPEPDPVIDLGVVEFDFG
jgi:hypothetical protein